MNVASSDFPILPIWVYLDNRRKYPCFQTIIKFPYRLTEETNNNAERSNPIDFEEYQITGEDPFIRNMKVNAMKVLNRFFSEVKFEKTLK